jgi:hypothetical protein
MSAALPVARRNRTVLQSAAMTVSDNPERWLFAPPSDELPLLRRLKPGLYVHDEEALNAEPALDLLTIRSRRSTPSSSATMARCPRPARPRIGR